MTTSTVESDAAAQPYDEPVHYRKTQHMLDAERRYARDTGRRKHIHDILLEAMLANDRDRDAAHSLGLLPPTFSHWIDRTGIRERVDAIRKERAA